MFKNPVERRPWLAASALLQSRPLSSPRSRSQGTSASGAGMFAEVARDVSHSLAFSWSPMLHIACQLLRGRLVLALSIAFCTGCATSSTTNRGRVAWPWSKPVDPITANIPAPHELMNEVREFAASADRYSPEEREKYAQQFAQGLRNEQDPLMRMEILRALSKARTPTGDALLRVGLQDPDRDVRVVCCEAWGSHGGAEAVDLLVGVMTQDTEHDVRMAAARALGTLGDRRAVASLGLALEDENPAMQRRAVESLKTITGEDLGNDVNAWASYIKAGAPQREISVAQRLRRLL